MVLGNYIFLMVVHIVVSLKMVLQKVMVDCYILMGIFIVDNGKMIKLMDMALMFL